MQSSFIVKLRDQNPLFLLGQILGLRGLLIIQTWMIPIFLLSACDLNKPESQWDQTDLRSQNDRSELISTRQLIHKGTKEPRSFINPIAQESTLKLWHQKVRVKFHDRVYDANGYEGVHTLRPAQRVRVDLTHVYSNEESDNGVAPIQDETRIASGYTDYDGGIILSWWGPPLKHYYDKRGEWNGPVMKIYVFAELMTTMGHRAEVNSRHGGEQYILEGVIQPNFTERDKPIFWAPHGEVFGEPIELISSPEGPLSGAFNILSMITKGYDMIGKYSDHLGPNLVISWDLDEPVSCGSCYVGDRILLGGQPEDPDHYDDHVILHEMGHYFTHRWSIDDSPGGSHRGRAVHPTLAYGEGVAYFWASLILDDPVIVDWMFPEPWVVDLERFLFNGEPMSWGLWEEVPSSQQEAHLSATHHEELVSSLMWSLFKQQRDELLQVETASEPSERFRGAFDLLMKVFVEVLPRKMTASFDIGAVGVDLADWLDSMSCHLMSGDRSLFESSLQALEQEASQREYPWRWSEARESMCSEKGSDLRLRLELKPEIHDEIEVVLDLVRREDLNNLASNSHQADQNQTNIQKDSPYLWQAWLGQPPQVKLLDRGMCEALPCSINSKVISEDALNPLIFTLTSLPGSSLGVFDSKSFAASWLSRSYKEYRYRGVKKTKYEGRSSIIESALVH